MTTGRGIALAFLFLVASADEAAAHSPIPGMQGFYLGMLHPLSTPPQLLSLLAAGLLLGLRWPGPFRYCWPAFAVSCLAGIALGQWGWLRGLEDTALLAGGIAAAILAALLTPKLTAPCVAISAWTGLFLGVASIPDEGPAWPVIVTLAGSFVGANLALVYLAFAVGSLRARFTAQWVGIGLRIAAAWIAAVAALMLALLLVDPTSGGGTGM
ncbi:HupE/UreJ family protein [Mesorhizobium marinum]|uniref:HupE/UreJ family protein n=1 Tax=Mesorhizobium marinum TaxID=3228790 RepID=A0ABV3R533_9HYPH